MLKKITFIVAGLAVVMLLAIVTRRPAPRSLTGPKRAPVKPSAPVQAVSSLPAEETPLKPEAKVYQPDYDQLVIKKYVQEFSLPQQLAQELLEAVQEVQPAQEPEPITKAERTQLITTARRDSVRRHGNIVAGYQVSDQTFEQIVSAALPDQSEEEASQPEDVSQAQPLAEATSDQSEVSPPDDISQAQPPAEPEIPLAEGPAASESAPEVAEEEEELLRSEALATLGLLAMLELNYAQAETAFRSLIEHYPDSESAPMARLELARLISEQGRAEEALSLVSEAIQLHGDDAGYCQIAEELEKVIITGNE